MTQKEKLKCPMCSDKFIPRTFYPEEAIFSTSDGKKLSGFNGYISSSGVKPTEVILSSWITYCPKCNYVLKFVKEIVKKEKIQAQSALVKDIKEKYNNYYFGFPFEDYSQYLQKATREVKATIESSLNKLNLSAFENMHEIKDTFKLLVRFYANLENYCNSQFSTEEDKNLGEKIKLLELSADLEEILIELNEIKDKTIHSDYELSNSDKANVNRAVTGFMLDRIKKHVKPLIDSKKLKNKYSYVDIRDLNSEIKLYLNGYFSSIFNNGRATDEQVKIFLDQLLVN
ncbi:MAG: hypothetical protein KGD58_05315 [Candidatus Lokiarchaeota archaeon]|nr:hypothetical protein [Candidatus Lokiarchaeota archaeon]